MFTEVSKKILMRCGYALWEPEFWKVLRNKKVITPVDEERTAICS